MRINGKWNIIYRADRCRLRSFKGRGNDRGGNAGVINQAPTGVDNGVAQPGGPYVLNKHLSICRDLFDSLPVG